MLSILHIYLYLYERFHNQIIMTDNIFEKRKILPKLVAFASDGASVMLGKNEGVATKLSRICTYPLIVNHCVAHRLALACKDAKKEIKFYEEIESLVKKIYFLQFYLM